MDKSKIKRFRLGEMIESHDRGKIPIEELFEAREPDGLCARIDDFLKDEDIALYMEQGIYVDRIGSDFYEEMKKTVSFAVLYAYVDFTQEEIECLDPEFTESIWLARILTDYSERIQSLKEEFNRKKQEIYNDVITYKPRTIIRLQAVKVPLEEKKEIAKNEIFKPFVDENHWAEALLQACHAVDGTNGAMKWQGKCTDVILTSYLYYAVQAAGACTEKIGNAIKFFNYAQAKLFPNMKEKASRGYYAHLKELSWLLDSSFIYNSKCSQNFQYLLDSLKGTGYYKEIFS